MDETECRGTNCRCETSGHLRRQALVDALAEELSLIPIPGGHAGREIPVAPVSQHVSAQLEVDVLVERQIDPDLLIGTVCFQVVGLGDKSQSSTSFWVHLTAVFQNDLVRIVVLGRHHDENDRSFIRDISAYQILNKENVVIILRFARGVDPAR